MTHEFGSTNMQTLALLSVSPSAGRGIPGKVIRIATSLIARDIAGILTFAPNCRLSCVFPEPRNDHNPVLHVNAIFPRPLPRMMMAVLRSIRKAAVP